MSENNERSGIVYVLTNPSMYMPERDDDEELHPIVKIGSTSPATRERLKGRLNELFRSPATGVALPFIVEYAKAVNDHENVEKQLHQIFAKWRVNRNREFFKIPVDAAIAALVREDGEEIALADGEEIEPDGKGTEGIKQSDIDAREKFSPRAPNFTFSELDIPVGAVLEFYNDTAKRATVVGDKTVSYDGEPRSLSKATQLAWGRGTPRQTLSSWKYEDRLLSDIRAEMME